VFSLCNENTADVCFEVSSVEEKEDDNDDRTKRTKTSTPFYAHRLVLRGCAPILAAICGSNDSGEILAALVNGVIKPDIFRHLLSYVPMKHLRRRMQDSCQSKTSSMLLTSIPS